MKTVVSFAGVDPSNGAGIYVDLAVIKSLGFHPAGVVTTLTYQNTCGVKGVVNLSDCIEGQADAVFEDLDIVGVKVGLVLKGCEVIAKYMKKVEVSVVDPVLVSTTGYDFENLDVYKFLAKHCEVLTPNVDEAMALSECRITDLKSARECAKEISRTYGCSVVITGGKLKGVDVIFDGKFYTVESKLFNYEVHGTGCVYSSALTCHLAKGLNLYEACKNAREVVLKAVENSKTVGRCLRVVNP
ncbi:bifunctional hydroxymethylpyrimidine kinase/phosphomethylpyrimidine kinase [Archaeoglobus profundus]|uniref:Phosphomethylpyrimidine kinase n=1 Tax=Archaeoglobus profundus (strain DSM 5631 / JCM 9629 / NBRC 100127 / Av18) TaxID=572546 RepID=D2REV1_ARCPA|nr:hydroxymethylpyrimidine/phosphomethylpyrimidine kinase [Archaeoglobus profundus]ADB58645.1 Phosphomethylpyrimidine kinase [Archaeoglobus profundus DSM 5631]